MKKWLAIGIVGLIVLGLALVLGGGIYRTVNAGIGGIGVVYVVNRFTGKTFLVSPSEVSELSPPRRLGGPDLAIALAKNCAVSSSSDEENDAWVTHRMREKTGPLRVLGWKAEGKGEGLYLVSFTHRYLHGQFGRPKGTEAGWWWEVDVRNRFVRKVNGDPDLTDYYGLEYARRGVKSLEAMYDAEAELVK